MNWWGKTAGSVWKMGLKIKKEGSNFRVKPANYMPKTQDKNLVQAETGRERERKREG